MKIQSLCSRLATTLFLIGATTLSATALPESDAPNAYEDTTIIRSGANDLTFRAPFVFREGTWVQFEDEIAEDIVICLAAHSLGDCVIYESELGEVWGVGLTPNCQGDRSITITFTIMRDIGSDIPIYFVDGYATFDRDEAEGWANETPGCTFDTIDEEW